MASQLSQFRAKFVSAAFSEMGSISSLAKTVLQWQFSNLFGWNPAFLNRKCSWTDLGPCHSQRRFTLHIAGMSKKKRERDFELLVEDEKPYKKVLALKGILMNEPEQVISFGDLGMMRRKVGMKGDRRFVNLIRRYPAIFEMYVDEERTMWCGFKERAEELIKTEVEMMKAYEPVAVNNVRKLLMMSVDKRLQVAKIAHLRRDLGLPEDFQKRVVYEYPQFFRVVEHPDGPILELTTWDPSLAVTSLEKKAMDAAADYRDAVPQFTFSMPKGYTVKKQQRAIFERFQALHFLSPYTDIRDHNKTTVEFEKRSVALLHEILSMTVEKRTITDYLTHFHKEYVLPNKLLAMLLRHYGIFYVSRKGGRLTVFLKEAYDGVHLIEKNEWMNIKEQFIELMALGKGPKRKDDKVGQEEAVDKQAYTENQESGSEDGDEELKEQFQETDEDEDSDEGGNDWEHNHVKASARL